MARIEGDNRIDLFGQEIFVIATAVVAGIVDGGGDGESQLVVTSGSGEAIKALERESEVGLGGLAQMDVDGQIVSAVVNDVLVESVAEIKGLAI